MNAKQLKKYYNDAWLSFFFFPRKLKLALDCVSLSETDNAFDRIDSRIVCERFELALQETGIIGWLFNCLYKKQIDSFSQGETYQHYLRTKNLSAREQLGSNATMAEQMIAFEKDMITMSQYINEGNKLENLKPLPPVTTVLWSSGEPLQVNVNPLLVQKLTNTAPPQQGF